MTPKHNIVMFVKIELKTADYMQLINNQLIQQGGPHVYRILVKR